MGDILPQCDSEVSAIVHEMLTCWSPRSHRIPFSGRNESELEDYVKMILDFIPIPHVKMGLEKRIRNDDSGAFVCYDYSY